MFRMFPSPPITQLPGYRGPDGLTPVPEGLPRQLPEFNHMPSTG